MNPVGETRKVLKGKFRQEVVEPREDDGFEFQNEITIQFSMVKITS